MRQHEMKNGRVVDIEPICHRCQGPNASVRADDGEWYHHECLP